MTEADEIRAIGNSDLGQARIGWCVAADRARKLEALLRRLANVRGTFGIEWSDVPGLTDVPLHSPGDEEEYGLPWRWRRGFIESVRLPLQAWLDHGRLLVQHHPIRRVTLSDREPNDMQGDPDLPILHGWYRWPEGVAADPGSMPYDLPGEVWDLLPLPSKPGRDSTWIYYPSCEAANDALSVACLSWAKQGQVTPATA